MDIDFSTIISVIAIFVLGFKAGEMFFALRIREAVRLEAHRQGFSTDEDEEVIVRKMIVEENDNQLFLYDFDDKEFICQGRSVQELAKKTKADRGINVAVVVHNKECYYFINGDVKNSL
jgi:hypothetical protein